MSNTRKHGMAAIIAAGVLATMIAGCGRGTVAKVNGRRITRQEYLNRLEHYRVPVPPAGQMTEAGLVVLQQLITEELILRLAEKEGVSPTEEQVNERLAQEQRQPGFGESLRQAGITRDQFKELVRVRQALFNLQTKGVKIPDERIKQFYEQNKDTQYTIPEYATVAGIFTEDKATMDKAKALLNKGVDFGAVARQLSSDPNSAEQNGRLQRRIYRGDKNIPDFVQNIVLSTPKGKSTDPIPGGDGGYVIFKILDHRPKRVQQFSEVKYSIHEMLMSDAGSKKNDVQAKLAKFRDTANISVGIERYKNQLLPKKPEKAPAAAR